MIDKNGHFSLYEQVIQTIKNEIYQGKYNETGYIGTQQELALRFDVSLITIRKAIGVLTNEKLVVSKQGKGTFVKNFVLSDNLIKLTGITNTMAKANLHPKVIVKSMMQINTPSYFDDEIKKKMGEECLFIERLHMLSDRVSGYARLYLPLEYGSKLTKEDIESNTIYQLYQNKFGVDLGKGIQNIRAAKALRRHSEIMEIEEGTPMLFIERFSYSSSGQIIEAMELFYEYTQYYFRVESNLSAE